MSYATELIRRVGAETSRHVTTIRLTTNPSEFIPNFHTNPSVILFNPWEEPIGPVINPATGLAVPQVSPPHITLAHELIHADRMRRGVFITPYTRSNPFDGGSSLNTYIRRAPWWALSIVGYWIVINRVYREELAAIGIRYNRPGDMIRAQFGLWLRACHTLW